MSTSLYIICSIAWNILWFSEYQQYQEAGADDDGEFIEEDDEEIPE